MERNAKIILGLIGLVIAGIVLAELFRPRPLDWNPSYTAGDKVPFGCYVLFNELPGLFPGQPVVRVEESLYPTLSRRTDPSPSNYILINESIELDGQETREVLDYVAQGNTVFLAASNLGSPLADSLKISTADDYGLLEGTAGLTLTHKRFKQEEYPLSKGNFNTHFTRVDSSATTILGHISYTRGNDLQGGGDRVVTKPNLIKTAHGKGHFVVSTTPEVYGNYYMLGGNSAYVAHSLSYLGEGGTLYWDDYKKAGRAYIDSPLRYVLLQPALKWAYYLALGGILLFVLFRAKREQRIIPLIEPLKNSSVEFAKAVGSLYYRNRDHSDLIDKKINHFLAYLRDRYHMETATLDQGSIRLLASRSGRDLGQTKDLIEYILALRGKGSHTEEEGLTLSKKITAFKP